MKTFTSTCHKCRSNNIHFIIESSINFGRYSHRAYELIVICLDCSNAETYLPEPAVPRE